jgi:hypothetical protein
MVMMRMVLGSFVAASRAGSATILAITIVIFGLPATFASSIGFRGWFRSYFLGKNIGVLPTEHARP